QNPTFRTCDLPAYHGAQLALKPSLCHTADRSLTVCQETAHRRRYDLGHKIRSRRIAMATATTSPAIEGWFTTGDAPALVGTRCAGCRTVFFPREAAFCRNPGCESVEFDEVELSREGRVWSYTDARYQP